LYVLIINNDLAPVFVVAIYLNIYQLASHDTYVNRRTIHHVWRGNY